MKRYRITKTRDGKNPVSIEGTLPELIQAYGYTLEVGASYSHEKRNAKINRHPTTIASLVSNLNKATNNAAANGYSGSSYSAEPLN